MSELSGGFIWSVWLRVISAALVVTGLGVVWIAPTVHERFFPVIQPGSSRITEHYLEPDGWTTFRLTFKKNYDCRSIAESTEWFWTDTDGQIGVLPWSAATNSHSPAGVVISPALRVLLPANAVNFYARVLYDCNLPWKIVGVLGPFDLPLH